MGAPPIPMRSIESTAVNWRYQYTWGVTAPNFSQCWFILKSLLNVFFSFHQFYLYYYRCLLLLSINEILILVNSLVTSSTNITINHFHVYFNLSAPPIHQQINYSAKRFPLKISQNPPSNLSLQRSRAQQTFCSQTLTHVCERDTDTHTYMYVRARGQTCGFAVRIAGIYIYIPIRGLLARACCVRLFFRSDMCWWTNGREWVDCDDFKLGFLVRADRLMKALMIGV